MTPQRYEQIRDIFLTARDQTPADRPAFLDRACAADADLRSEVDALLASDQQAETFLQTPALGPRFAVDSPEAIGSSARFDIKLPDSPPAPLPKQVGPYTIIDRIGSGGMGVVYRAEQDQPRRIVALKVVRPGLESDETLRRFEHEGEVLGWLRHPGIAQIYQAGTADTGLGPQPYFAMEYIEGLPLTDFAARHKLGLRARIKLIIHTCEAVHHAHQKGIIHRDLKPGNILVDEAGQPKVVDFGVARVTRPDHPAGSGATIPGQLVGTLAYMSPEQITGDASQLDIRSDVYALGVIAYELLAGHLPFQLNDVSLPQAARIITEEESPSLGSEVPALRGDVEAIVARALAKDKSDRYPSAMALADDFRRYLNSEPVSARPITTWYQFTRFARRNRTLVGGVAATLVALLVGVVGTTWQAVVAANERNNARAAELVAEQRRQQAEQEAAKAQQINNFLVDMFEAVDPSVVQGYDVSLMLLLLDEAARTIDRDFEQQPAVRAALQDTIGWVYLKLGLYEQAAPQLTAAYQRRLELLGPDDPDTLDSLHHTAILDWYQGNIPSAIQTAEKVVEQATRILGPRHRDTITARYDLAGLHRAAGAFDQAERELRALIHECENTFGPEDNLTIELHNGLGVLLNDRAAYDEAIDMLRSVYEIWKSRRGERHPSTLATMLNLGSALRAGGQLDEAVHVQNRLAELADEVYGLNHPETIQAHINLASTLNVRGESVEAEQVGRTALERSIAVNGPDHPTTLIALGNLAITLRTVGQLDEAAGLFDRAVKLSEQLRGVDHPAHVSLLNGYAGLLYKQGRLDDAETLMEQVIAAHTAIHGADHIETITAMNNLALLLLEREKFTEAEELLRRLVTLVDQAAPPGHWFRGNVRKLHGRALMLLEQTQPAEQELLLAYDNLSAALGTTHDRTVGAVNFLIELYESLDRPSDADQWRAKLPTENALVP